MLVSPTQNSCIGGMTQCDGPTRGFCRIAVEYRLKAVCVLFSERCITVKAIFHWALSLLGIGN